MGSQILKISPFSYSKSLVSNPTSLSRILLKPAPSRTHNNQFRASSAKPRISPTVSASGFGALFHQSKRSFRGSVIIAMAAPGSVQKSEEEWRAVLSPEQFRIRLCGSAPVNGEIAPYNSGGAR